MDHLGIQKKMKNKKGEIHWLALHGRLEIYKLKSPTIGEQLLAIKWLGNSGTHDLALTADELLDGFELLEHNLEEILEKKAARMVALAKGLTKRHRRRH
jgi:hypothetical protein